LKSRNAKKLLGEGGGLKAGGSLERDAATVLVGLVVKS
jgi:hypothetical protein